jgi:chromosome segregation protein
MKLEFVEVAGFRGFREKTRFEIPPGFAVLVGRNGAGKSTVLDAIDFALTGTINKFDVKTAKGGGLDNHIWWVGDGRAEEHSVSVGFVDAEDNKFVVTRDRTGHHSEPAEIIGKFCLDGSSGTASIETLMQTSLIRDERIVAFSLDLPEQQRFSAVRTAIGGIVGPDYSERTSSLVKAADYAKDEHERRFIETQAELGRTLTDLTEARSLAERSTDIAEALLIIDALKIDLPAAPGERAQAIRGLIADRKQALQHLEVVRRQAESLLPEIKYLNSPDAKKEKDALQENQRNAARDLQVAGEAMNAALRAQRSEQDADVFAAHINSLLEHGHALGLQDGHCPLCNAIRNEREFSSAIAAARTRLAERGKRLHAASEDVAKAKAQYEAAQQSIDIAQSKLADFSSRIQNVETELSAVRETYKQYGFDARAEDTAQAQILLLKEQEELVRLERALFILEASSAMERVKVFETRNNSLKLRLEREAAKLATAETAANLAKQIDSAAKMVANELLTEQFDTVMPLLKELYRRLRPHAGWTEIESDFGGKVRASLNFTVGDGHNVQFLFSSGQRRAAGLAFLLAIHLSRRWCNWQTLLLDDPVQHIDDYRALNLVEVLSAIRRTGRQVVVAVEDEALADVLCRRLRSSVSQAGRRFNLRTSTSGTGEIASIRDIYPMPREVIRPATTS